MDERFKAEARELGAVIATLWIRTRQAMDQGQSEDQLDEIMKLMRTVNRLHRKLFPEFEHSLYGDDFELMLEGVDESGEKE